VLVLGGRGRGRLAQRLDPQHVLGRDDQDQRGQHDPDRQDMAEGDVAGERHDHRQGDEGHEGAA
jgi:hypothetical protein